MGCLWGIDMARKKNSVINFLTQDVRSASETKELAVMLRCLNILYMVYFIFISVQVAVLEHYFFSLVLIFAIGILTGSFICTYENKTNLALILFILTIISAMSWLTICVGYNKNYHWIMLNTIPLVFFNPRLRMTLKMLYSEIIAAFALTVSMISHAHPVLRTAPSGLTAMIIVVNLIAFTGSTIIISYFFSSKFRQSEEKIQQYTDNLKRMASVDALTGLYNRRHMNEHLKEMADASVRSGKSFCIAIGDVDLFKSINDTYGHDTGDYVLVTISTLFQDFMKDYGVASRWGGEEFLFSFRSGNLADCYSKLEALRKQIAAYNFSFKDHQFHVSMTFGLEEFNEALGIETTISRADAKLYTGKENGRNQVVR